MGTFQLSNDILNCGQGFQSIQDFSPLIEKFKDKQLIMLGGASHGTSEFYEWRSRITLELIQKHGYNFVAVEGDWPRCQEMNEFVQTPDTIQPYEVLSHFSRWPTWMWANDETVDFMEKLQGWNLSTGACVGFHGLDLYSLYESMNQVVLLLEEIEPKLAQEVKGLFACFDSYQHDEIKYASSLLRNPAGCEKEVVRVLGEILKARIGDDDQYFELKQNAKIIQNAESYYRSMIFETNRQSWNVRDEHMLETLQVLLHRYGPKSKGVVWAHNSHACDYRGTDLVLHHQVNLGGLTRKTFGEESVALIGFSSYVGSVLASHSWGGPLSTMELPEAKMGSLDRLLHQHVDKVGHKNFYLDFSKVTESSALHQLRGHRAVGVVYDPAHEEFRNYVPTAVAKSYDALIYLDETKALSPLGFFAENGEFPDTYPSADLP